MMVQTQAHAVTQSASVVLAGFQRNNHNLRRKFYQFIVPALLSNIAVYLDQVIDSIIVAQTLGPEAMAMVNMASPLTMVMSTIYLLLGDGGTAIYTSLKGKLDKELASSILTLTMLLAALAGLLYLGIGVLFLDEVVNFLAAGLTLGQDFTTYILVLILTAPLIICLQTLILFFPAEGQPQYTTIINIINNATNLICDYIYITYFHWGLAGAVYATLTGYILGLLYLGYLKLQQKIPFTFGPLDLQVLGKWQELISMGLAPALGQLGFFAKISFSNYMAAFFAGATGVVIFSSCIQTVSFITIFLGGIIGAMFPLVAMLHGQKDYQGLKLLMQYIMSVQTVGSVVVCVFLELWAVQILALFNITDSEALNVGVTALRIFSLMYLCRQTIVLFMFYFQIIGHKVYAITLSVLDGFLGIMVLSWIFCWCLGLGITGLWLAYPACSFGMLLGILTYNYWQQKHSNGRLQGIFLLPLASVQTSVLDVTLPGRETEIVKFAAEVERFAVNQGASERKAFLAAQACEEICACAIQHVKPLDLEIDTFIQVSRHDITMSFRSLGPSFNTLTQTKSKELQQVAQDMRYDYLMGMNYTRIVI